MALNLVLDIGGTRLKWAWHLGHEVHSTGAALWADAEAQLTSERLQLEAELGHPLSRAARLARPWPPAGDAFPEMALSRILGVALEEVDPIARAPFDIGYTSGQPGADRIAAAAACHGEDPDGSFILIDAGTCVTVDLLSPGRWRGGAILPGLSLQARAMAHAGLPVITPLSDGRWNWNPSPDGALGTDTRSAIEAGIPRALSLAVEQTVRDLMTLDPRAQIRLTGGDALHFDGLGGWRTFADPNLVLTGTALLLNAPSE